MRLTAYLTISPASVPAGQPPCSKGWKFASITETPPASVTAFSKVIQITLDIPESELDILELKLKWPDGEPDPETVAELKQWVNPNP